MPGFGRREDLRAAEMVRRNITFVTVLNFARLSGAISRKTAHARGSSLGFRVRAAGSSKLFSALMAWSPEWSPPNYGSSAFARRRLWARRRTISLIADFYDHPALYDALLPVGAHLPYYVDLARQHAGDVLELACGTGQLAVPIARTGLPTVGLDLAAAMLTAARDSATRANVSVEFVQGDMRRFDLRRRFPFIFIARNSLLHLASTEDILATFAAVRRHLAPRGIFAFDVFTPAPGILARPPGQRFPVMDVMTEAFGYLSVESTHDYDPVTQVDRGTWYISCPGKPDAWVVSVVVRSIFPQELPLLVSAGGFELVDRFGSLSRTPFGPGSPLQVCLCRAAP